MRVKHLASKNKMTKGKAPNSATSWVPSAILQKEVEKAKTDGLISSNDSIKFLSTERIPQPPEWLSGDVPFLPLPRFVSSCP
jgi:hypothetical protein